MELLKRHLFLISLIVAIAVLGGGALFVIHLPKAKENAEQVTKRERRSQDISAIRRGGANQNQVQAMKEYVREAQTEAAKTTAKAVDLNRQGLESFVVHIKETDERIRVFPVDKEKHDRGFVNVRYAEVYREAMESLLDELKAASPPA